MRIKENWKQLSMLGIGSFLVGICYALIALNSTVYALFILMLTFGITAFFVSIIRDARWTILELKKIYRELKSWSQ